MNQNKIEIGTLVRAQPARHWWGSKVGYVSESRNGLFFCADKGDWIEKAECKVHIGDDFIWHKAESLEVIYLG